MKLFNKAQARVLRNRINSDTPIGDLLAIELGMKKTIDSLKIRELPDIHRMTYSDLLEEGKEVFVINCESCDFENIVQGMDALTREVTAHTLEVIDA